jgi:hypothetical protein
LSDESAPRKGDAVIAPIEQRAEALCADPLFREWLYAAFSTEVDEVKTAADAERAVSILCGVLYLEDLEEPEARASFAEKISVPFLRWKRSPDRALPETASHADEQAMRATKPLFSLTFPADCSAPSADASIGPCRYATFCSARIRAGDYPGGCSETALKTCATGLLIRLDWKADGLSDLSSGGSRGARTSTRASRYWTEEEISFLRSHYDSMTFKDIAARLGRSLVVVQAKAKGLGLEGKSKFGLYANKKPIGSERKRGGYLIRKVADTGDRNVDWRPVHHVIWERANGPIPHDHLVLFTDGNAANTDIGNLELVSRAELLARHTVHSMPQDLKELIFLKVAVQNTIHAREKSGNH